MAQLVQVMASVLQEQYWRCAGGRRLCTETPIRNQQWKTKAGIFFPQAALNLSALPAVITNLVQNISAFLKLFLWGKTVAISTYQISRISTHQTDWIWSASIHRVQETGNFMPFTRTQKTTYYLKVNIHVWPPCSWCSFHCKRKEWDCRTSAENSNSPMTLRCTPNEGKSFS